MEADLEVAVGQDLPSQQVKVSGLGEHRSMSDLPMTIVSMRVLNSASFFPVCKLDFHW